MLPIDLQEREYRKSWKYKWMQFHFYLPSERNQQAIANVFWNDDTPFILRFLRNCSFHILDLVYTIVLKLVKNEESSNKSCLLVYLEISVSDTEEKIRKFHLNKNHPTPKLRRKSLFKDLTAKIKDFTCKI